MKKIFSTLCLIIGGFAIPIAFSFFATILTFITFPVGFLINIFLLLGFIIGIKYIIKLLINKFKISVRKIIIYCELPSFILSIFSFILVKYLINNNYFNDGMLAGLAEYLLSILWLICSISILIITIIYDKKDLKNDQRK